MTAGDPGTIADDPGTIADDPGTADEARPVADHRIRLDLAYDGTGFKGWARQPHLRTVQGTL